MTKALETVRNELGVKHREVTDTVVREHIRDVIENGLLIPVPGYSVSKSLGMYTRAGNREVRAALTTFLEEAGNEAHALGLHSRAERLKAFEEDTIPSRSGYAYDWYFGRLHIDEASASDGPE